MSGKGKGKGGKGKGGSPYVIDEMVELEDLGGRKGYVWNIDEDIDPTSEYVLRAIVRDPGKVTFYLLPDEEVEPFKNGDNFWPEWSSGSERKISEQIKVNTENEKPYFHSGDLKLAIQETYSNADRVTVKFREADD